MGRVRTVARNAPEDGEHLACGPVATSGASCRNQLQSSAMQWHSMVSEWGQNREFATTAYDDVQKRRQRLASEVQNMCRSRGDNKQSMRH
mgnify:CR=1 FL=1